MTPEPPAITETARLTSLLEKKDAEIRVLQAQLGELPALRALLQRHEHFLSLTAAIFPALEACQPQQQHLWAEFKRRRQADASPAPFTPPCAQ